MRCDQGQGSRSILWISLIVALSTSVSWVARVESDCENLGPIPVPNVLWSLKDSVSVCPAGDSLTTTSHPSKLRLQVFYDDGECNAKIGVPPESIWVTTYIVTGNLVVNDMAEKIYADDSTTAMGMARFTISSFSGCGKVRLELYVAGVDQGHKDALVRSTDTDADGRTTGDDWSVSTACDLNYDSVVGGTTDIAAVAPHETHWHRNALFGTLVRRTNYCENCEDEAADTKGESQVAWSPSQRYLVHTAFVDAAPAAPSCKVFIVPASPLEGNTRFQLTSSPLWQHDYDPSWSPLNDVIVFDRTDSVIIKKQVPWAGTTETAITASNNCGCGPKHGDDIPAVSPDGQWIAFSRCNAQAGCGGTGGWSIWKAPVGGGTAQQLTSAAARTDFYASWSPDGQTVYFQRQDAEIGPQWTLWSVPADSGTAVEIFEPTASTPDTFDAVQPASSPDGLVLTLGYGRRDFLVRRVTTHTLDASFESANASSVVPNYPDTTFAEKGDFPILSPRWSQDGTRLALGSKQIWASRRNMNLPPQFTQVGSQGIADTTAMISINAAQGLESTVELFASDSENDPIACSAYFLTDGMSFDASACRLTWTPSLSIGSAVHVKFLVTTASGGCDAVIAKLNVVSSQNPSKSARAPIEPNHPMVGPNPTHGEFMISVPNTPGIAQRLEVSDISGRRVASLRADSGLPLVWDGRNQAGELVVPGIYLYRFELGRYRKTGKIVVVR